MQTRLEVGDKDKGDILRCYWYDALFDLIQIPSKTTQQDSGTQVNNSIQLIQHSDSLWYTTKQFGHEYKCTEVLAFKLIPCMPTGVPYCKIITFLLL